MEYSIHEVAKATGITSRTLRHYDSIGLLKPSRVGHNGYRFYDNGSLVRLQRILMLRHLGLGLDSISDVLRSQASGSAEELRVLREHLGLLQREQQRLASQMASVERTISALESATNNSEGVNLMEENIFEGFDHAQYKDEVIERWGEDSFAQGDRWWKGLDTEAKNDWKDLMEQLGRDWIDAAQRGEDPASQTSQDLARRHVAWLRGIPGTPAHEAGGDLAGYVLSLADMYVADERFAANYGGVKGAEYVRDALNHFVETELL